MVRDLAFAFTVFFLVVALACASGWWCASALGGQGLRDFFREATLATGFLGAVALCVAVGP